MKIAEYPSGVVNQSKVDIGTFAEQQRSSKGIERYCSWRRDWDRCPYALSHRLWHMENSSVRVDRSGRISSCRQWPKSTRDTPRKIAAGIAHASCPLISISKGSIRVKLLADLSTSARPQSWMERSTYGSASVVCGRFYSQLRQSQSK
jgi:hypothetical protein